MAGLREGVEMDVESDRDVVFSKVQSVHREAMLLDCRRRMSDAMHRAETIVAALDLGDGALPSDMVLARLSVGLWAIECELLTIEREVSTALNVRSSPDSEPAQVSSDDGPKRTTSHVEPPHVEPPMNNSRSMTKTQTSPLADELPEWFINDPKELASQVSFEGVKTHVDRVDRIADMNRGFVIPKTAGRILYETEQTKGSLRSAVRIVYDAASDRGRYEPVRRGLYRRLKNPELEHGLTDEVEGEMIT